MTQNNNGSGAANAGVIARYVVLGALVLGGGFFALKTFVLDKGSAPVPGQQTTAPTNGNGGFNLPHLGGNGADLSATKNYLAGRPLRVRGSTSAVTQVKAIANAANNQGVKVQYLMTGSGPGIDALKNGTADIAVVSKQVTDPALEVTPIGSDSVVLFVSVANPVSTLSAEQVQGIMSGRITNWREVGGNDEAITLRQRASGGTKEWFESVFGPVSPNAKVLPDGTTDLFQDIEKDRGAVGYGTSAQAQAMVKVVTISDGDTTRQIYAATKIGAPDGIKQMVRFMKDNFNK